MCDTGTFCNLLFLLNLGGDFLCQHVGLSPDVAPACVRRLGWVVREHTLAKKEHESCSKPL